jgi:hypothetical protein
VSKVPGTSFLVLFPDSVRRETCSVRRDRKTVIGSAALFFAKNSVTTQFNTKYPAAHPFKNFFTFFIFFTGDGPERTGAHPVLSSTKRKTKAAGRPVYFTGKARKILEYRLQSLTVNIFFRKMILMDSKPRRVSMRCI